MASNNKLLSSGRVVVEKAESLTDFESDRLGWPKRLYRADCKAGKVFKTFSEQEEQFKLGWVESPADIGKVVESVPEPVVESITPEPELDLDSISFDSFEDKKSIIDLSVDKPKPKAKTKFKK